MRNTIYGSYEVGTKMHENLRRIICAIFVITVVTAGCSRRAELGTRSSADITRVRFVHAALAPPTVDMYIDDIKATSDLAIGKTSGYVSLLAGKHNLRVFAAGSSEEPIVEFSQALNAESDYTAFYMGKGETAKLLVQKDDNSQPPVNKAKIRFVNAVQDMPLISVRVIPGDTILLGPIGFAKVAKYKEIDAGTYDFTMAPEEYSTVLARAAKVEIKSQGVYTIVAEGQVTTNTASLEIYQDNIEPPTPPR